MILKEQSCSAAQKKVNDHDAAKAELSHALMQANADSYTKKLNDETAALKRA